MFKKLRNRFLLLNLVIISIIMFVAFAAIYTITYQNVQNDIHMDLNRVSENFHKDKGPYGQRPKDMTQPSGSEDLPPAERSLSFTLYADQNWQLTGSESPFDMDSDLYNSALQVAASSEKDIGRFTLDDSDWAYTVQTTTDGHMIVYLDITAQNKILLNLIYTFAAVSLAMLIVIYFTSRFFANRAIQPIQEAFDKQKQFIADASHELKTPLTIINTNADVMLANSQDTIENQAKWLYYMKSETERMSKLTNDLLFLTEMDDARADILFAGFDLSEAVEHSLLTMEAVIFEKQIKLDYDIEPDLAINGSSEQIKQVVMILLDNAVKYTKPDGTITLTLKRQNHEAVLSVSNTGEGIAPEHLTRIFDRFYRTDTSRARKQGGYGLGLAIAKSIVDQHKGKITAKSVLGESTTFTVQLSGVSQA